MLRKYDISRIEYVGSRVVYQTTSSSLLDATSWRLYELLMEYTAPQMGMSATIIMV